MRKEHEARAPGGGGAILCPDEGPQPPGPASGVAGGAELPALQRQGPASWILPKKPQDFRNILRSH